MRMPSGRNTRKRMSVGRNNNMKMTSSRISKRIPISRSTRKR